MSKNLEGGFYVREPKKNPIESMKGEELEKFISNLRKIQGQPLSYSKLCEALNLPKKSSNSKTAQLNDLKVICNFDISSSPTRYTITEVFSYLQPCMDFLNSNAMRIQLSMESALFQAFLNNNGKSLYLSNMELLKTVGAVNENFAYCIDYKALNKIDKNLLYMSDMVMPVYRLLSVWVKRKIEKMVIRGTFHTGFGFRLYRYHRGQYGMYITKHDVPRETELNKECMALFNQAVNHCLPRSWGGEWVSVKTWENFEKYLDEITTEYFEGKGDYYKLRRITVYEPSKDEWILQQLKNVNEQLNALQEVNSKSKSKILTGKHIGITYDKQGDEVIDSDFTIMQRDKFVDYNIDLHPPVIFKEVLKQINYLESLKEKE